MFHTVLQYCKKEKLIEAGDLVLAGVSGGADSVCLLLLLKELQKEIPFSLEAVHVEHGIRGAESEADAAFVEKLCREKEISLQVFHVQAPAFASEQKLGLEEAARELRYDCYKRAAQSWQEKTRQQVQVKAAQEMSETAAWKRPVKIALAHHGDDNAETVLFQMIRGSGIDGLGGMQPKRMLSEDVEVIRPMLGVTRAQIEAYLKECGQDYCIDSTNEDVTYSRNKLRQEVIPMLGEINAQAVAHINQSAAFLREVGSYLKEQVSKAAIEVLAEEETSILIRQECFLSQPALLQQELLHLALTKAAGAAKDIGANHVDALAELFDLQVGRSISLPYGVVAKRVYEGVRLGKEAAADKAKDGAYMPGQILFLIDKEELTARLQNGSYEVSLPEGEIRFTLLERMGKSGEISKKTYTKCFDYDKMKGSFQIRTRQAGDYLMIDENQHKKRLKEYFINEKIPQEVRERTLLLAENSKILWVIGGRISADMKISEQTTKILKVQITGGNYHEN